MEKVMITKGKKSQVEVSVMVAFIQVSFMYYIRKCVT